MTEWMNLYPHAVEHTKTKLMEDLDRYLEDKEKIPSFEQFLADRKHYIEQIWMNVWLNIVTNDVSKAGKKAYLKEAGYEVEGVDRKLINQLFRNEMRTYRSFDAIQWLNDTFGGRQSEWEERYEKRRVAFLKQEKEKKLFEKKADVKKKIIKTALKSIKRQHLTFYLYFRYYVACQLEKVVNKN